LKLLSKKKVYIYAREYFNIYGKKIYIDFNKYFNEKKASKIYLLKNKENVLKHSNSILILKENSIDIMINLITLNNLVIFTNIDYEFDYYNVMPAICDIFYIPQACHEKQILTLCNVFLEYGKNIYVTPGNIFDKFSHFSNILISEGAYVILDKKDFNDIL
ncbi:MAG: hypothetical protein RSA08_02795, partial [Clostridia bacterium]